MTNKALIAEYGRLVDEKFFGRLTEKKAARLEHIKQELDRLEAPKAKRLEKQMAREHKLVEQQIDALRAKISQSAPGRPQAKTAASK